MAPLLECHEASKHHLLKFGFFLLDSINLGFLLRKRLATVLIIPSYLGSQLGGYPARINDQDCDGACHLKNYSFVITYLLEDEQELSLGMLDTSQTYL
jgi:hypothetical protein